jgi:glyoxylase-like metal-dependent hydrolase (beta-lactamase superfamily II)
MSVCETYEILAIKYGRHAKRTRADNFMAPDDHASPQPIDYFVWVIRNSARTILVDTGFDHAEAKSRDRVLDREPAEALALLGIGAQGIADVVVTHLHYDHAGTLDRFPAARFHLQEAEMAYATGRCMCEEAMRKPFSAEHVCEMVKNVYAGRVQFHDGDGEVAPGVTVHKCAGHTQGLQAIRVKTTGGYVVLAMDAAHLYENIERRKPFSITIDVAETLRTYDKLYALASSKAQVVPGHDPLILERYPALSAATKGVVHRLDAPWSG